MIDNLLFILILIPVLGAIPLLIIPVIPYRIVFIKKFGFVCSLLTFLLSLFLWVLFDNSSAQFQFVNTVIWVDNSTVFSLGVDGISIFFVLLTTFLIPVCLLASWNITIDKFNIGFNYYFAAFLFLESFVLIVFTSLDLLVFYTFFEAVLIPMFLIVGVWGSRERKVRAAYIFFLYTLVGSLFILVALLLIFFETGSLDYDYLVNTNYFSYNRQLLLWLGFFFSFAVKIPIIPVHNWLPEAHVEAPTAGSVILAGVLLKLGSYGLIRFSLVLFPGASIFFRPLVFMLAIVAIIYTSITALRQSDIKRVIAYASVAHINTTLIGLFSFTQVGLEGSLFQIISHGVVSGALFLCVGVLYDRHHSRIIKYYSGVVHTIPLFVSIFLFFTLANIALPGSSSFVGEFLIFAGAFSLSKLAVFFSATGMFLGGAYSLWLFNRVAYANFKTQFITQSYDVNRREFYLFLPLIFFTLFFGLFPSVFFETIHVSCSLLLEKVLFYLLLYIRSYNDYTVYQ